MNIPNTFIIGAPKCGTTAMAHYLSFHPQIFMSHIKEPHYFIKDDMPKMCTFDKDEYLSLFSEAKEQHKVIMEASVWYLYGENSIPNIKLFNAHSKLIIMLRRPDEMVYSMHNQNYITRNDDLDDFSLAWSLVDKRRNGEEIPKHCRNPKLLEYDRIACYYTQLERVYRHFKKENVLVMLFDDFKKSPKNCYERVQQFLGLEKFTLDEFQRINESKTIRSEMFANIITRPPQSVLKLAKFVRKTFGIKEIGIRGFLKSLNQKVQKRAPLDEVAKLRLVESYKSEMIELEGLLQEDLSHWYKS